MWSLQKEYQQRQQLSQSRCVLNFGGNGGKSGDVGDVFLKSAQFTIITYNKLVGFGDVNVVYKYFIFVLQEIILKINFS